MTLSTPFVFVIDDDESVRRGLKRFLRSANYESEVFKSASDFLARPAHPGPACGGPLPVCPGMGARARREEAARGRSGGPGLGGAGLPGSRSDRTG